MEPSASTRSSLARGGRFVIVAFAMLASLVEPAAAADGRMQVSAVILGRCTVKLNTASASTGATVPSLFSVRCHGSPSVPVHAVSSAVAAADRAAIQPQTNGTRVFADVIGQNQNQSPDRSGYIRYTIEY